MKQLLGKAALMFLISGIVCIAEGLAILLWHGISFHGLTYLFAFPIIIRGSIQFVYGVHRRLQHPWLIVLFLLGIVNMAIGYFIVFYPLLTEMGFTIIMGTAWAANGFALLLLALYLYREAEADSRLILSGIFSMAAGMYVMLNLPQGFVSVVWLTALYEILFGVIIFLFGVRAKTWNYLDFKDYGY
jgi:uncharacterized membrane protein HdeD (DUF308 family)